MRQSPKFVVNQRNQPAQRLFIAGPPLGQELTDRLGRDSWQEALPPTRVCRSKTISPLLSEVNFSEDIDFSGFPRSR